MVKMTSFESPISQSHSDSPEGTESSDFTVLSCPPSSVGNMSDSLNPMNSIHMAIMSATPDLSLDEVHQWLKELLRENIELKDALQRNNTLMQEQLSTVAAWHEQMVHTNNNQRMMLEEATKAAHKLQQEKEYLYQKVEQLECTPGNSVDSHLCSQCKILENKLAELQNALCQVEKEKNDITNELTTQQNMRHLMEKDLEGISTDMCNLQSSSRLLENEKRELTALNNELHIQLSKMNLLGEVKDGEADIITDDDENGYAIVIQSENAKGQKADEDHGLKETLLQLHEERAKVSELTQELLEEKVQVACFKKLLDEKNKQICILKEQKHLSMAPVQGVELGNGSLQYPPHIMESEALHHELEISQQRLQLTTSYVQKYRDRCESLQHHMEDYQAKLENLRVSDTVFIEQLQVEIKNLQQILSQEQAKNQEDKNSLLEAKQHLEQLMKDYDKVLKTLEKQETEEKAKSEQMATMQEIEQRQHIEQLDILTAQLFNAEQELEANTQKYNNIKKEFSTLKEDAENIPILKAQVEVYKHDFESEKAARESAQKELEKLSSEVKYLREQLSGVNKFGTSSTYSGQRRSPKHYKFEASMKKSKSKNAHSTNQESLSASPSSSMKLLSCPRCALGFRELQALQNHVEECLNQDDSFL